MSGSPPPSVAPIAPAGLRAQARALVAGDIEEHQEEAER